ncbi:MAG: hypothetical protein JWO94_3189 [Verrucomicrobiaceae bacterium]|nr:hypothetical protein [Verrucomicrobiaceae bacterium]
MPRINLQTPDGQAFEAELTADLMTVGRTEDNDLEIPDGSVSSHHGQITNEGGHWVFTDLGSTNGTKVNGERVERVELGHGAAFEIGSVAAVFYEDAVQAAPASRGGTAPRTSTAAAGGFGTTPIERSARTGFGPKVKAKDGPRTMIMTLGVIGLLAAVGVGFLLFSGGLH